MSDPKDLSKFQGAIEYTYQEVTYLIYQDYEMWITTDKEDGESCSTWPTKQYSLEGVLEELRHIIEDE